MANRTEKLHAAGRRGGRSDAAAISGAVSSHERGRRRVGGEEEEIREAGEPEREGIERRARLGCDVACTLPLWVGWVGSVRGVVESIHSWTFHKGARAGPTGS
ncbi:hypothetical protein GUJ93_ZPchr0003g16771 [Zizania palustris]|uniref:Uncharacterized protein n=1 Tax=Zizania palustris TaxID=103762 RepID=A0A8J5ST84_ZIZPA|nr:hypothetical protein GUJ93_ZPchr0003g16771 [Zizania palustris]